MEGFVQIATLSSVVAKKKPLLRSFKLEAEGDRFIDQGWGDRRTRYQVQRPGEQEDVLRKVKVKLPSFEGKCDPNLYMEWAKNMEQVWTCHIFLELRKVQVDALEFQDVVMMWWDNLLKKRRNQMEQPMATWLEMKASMKARFILAHYSRDLGQRLENLKQGSMSADEAYNAMQVDMIKSNVRKDDEATNARYLRVLKSSLSIEVDM